MTSAESTKRSLTVAMIGNPNTGKSTLFNALAGMQSRVGNYPGVTVEKKIGRVQWGNTQVTLVDLPGTYSLSPRTRDEMVSVDVLLGRQADVGELDGVVCIVDASNLERNLYLVSQVLDIGLPVILAANMCDVAESRGILIDLSGLHKRLGIPVVTTQAHRRRGIVELRHAIEALGTRSSKPPQRLFPPKFYEEVDQLVEKVRETRGEDLPFYLAERMLLDVHGEAELEIAARDKQLARHLEQARERLKQAGCRIPAVEARVRYAWARELLDGVASRPDKRVETTGDKLDRLLTHRVAGLAVFAAVMFVVFQALYRFAGVPMDWIETAQEWLASGIAGVMPPGALRSLLIDGVIAGVGGVVVFLPQILILFLFIAILEDCGYMARAAFLMDKLMTKVGLNGKSFVPLMSSFACAIPGIMATRTIENYRDRMVTILVAPLMSCSARLPVYVLLIGAFVPPVTFFNGWIGLHGIVLFAMSCLGLLVAIPVAWLLKKTWFKGDTPPFVMELPSYKWPSPWIVLHRVYDRGKAFITRAGTLIFATTIVVWAAAYFPGDHSQLDAVTAQIEQLEVVAGPDGPPEADIEPLLARQNELSSELIAGSLLGRVGHAIEPVVRPLGWDWKIGVGAIASFPAREVIIATLGTIYSLGGDVDEEDTGLKAAMHEAKWPDRRPVYNVPVALSIMVFFALCAQCAATLMVIKRETNSWRWPAFAFTYMTVLAYVGALITYQVGMLFT